MAARVALPYDVAQNRYVKAIDVAGNRVFASVLRTSATENTYVFDGRTARWSG
ncbi:MAG: hypothetical protein M3Y07_00310 [Acidobacteriota bacterium]|nr:hypothetical protein [Acidobacteriota bacterium]